jgi:hypothetical protein
MSGNGKNGNGNRLTNVDTRVLSPKQALLAYHLGNLLDTRTREEKTLAVGVTRQCRSNWMRIPAFINEIARVAAETKPPLECEAIETCARVMRRTDDDKTAVMAARTIMQHLKEAGGVHVVTTVVQTNERKRELSEKSTEELHKILENRMSRLGRIDDLVGVGGSSDNKPERN